MQSPEDYIEKACKSAGDVAKLATDKDQRDISMSQLKDHLAETSRLVQLETTKRAADLRTSNEQVAVVQKQSSEAYSIASSSKEDSSAILRQQTAQQEGSRGLDQKILDLKASCGTKEEVSTLSEQLRAYKADLQAFDQKVLELAASSAAKLLEGLAEVQQACSKRLDSSAQESLAGQAGLQKEAVRITQRLEGLAAQHAAFAERLIAAEARAAGEASPRGIREAVLPGKQESGMRHPHVFLDGDAISFIARLRHWWSCRVVI